MYSAININLFLFALVQRMIVPALATTLFEKQRKKSQPFIVKSEPLSLFASDRKIVTSYSTYNLLYDVDLMELTFRLNNACNCISKINDDIDSLPYYDKQGSAKIIQKDLNFIRTKCDQAARRINNIIDIFSTTQRVKRGFGVFLISAIVVSLISAVTLYNTASIEELGQEAHHVDRLIGTVEGQMRVNEYQNYSIANAEKAIRHNFAYLQKEEKISIIQSKVSICKSSTDALRDEVTNLDNAVRQILNGKFPHDLMDAKDMNKHMQEVKKLLRQDRYNLLIHFQQEAYQLPATAIITEKGLLRFINPFPIYTDHAVMTLYRVIPTPLIDTHDGFFSITPDLEYFALSDDEDKYLELRAEDLINCIIRGDAYICPSLNIRKRSRVPSCAMALYKNNKVNTDDCILEHHNVHEQIHQLNSTAFQVWSRNGTQVFVRCTGNDDYLLKSIDIGKGTYLLILPPGCSAFTEQYEFNSEGSTLINSTTTRRQISINIDDIFVANSTNIDKEDTIKKILRNTHKLKIRHLLQDYKDQDKFIIFKPHFGFNIMSISTTITVIIIIGLITFLCCCRQNLLQLTRRFHSSPAKNNSPLTEITINTEKNETRKNTKNNNYEKDFINNIDSK